MRRKHGQRSSTSLSEFIDQMRKSRGSHVRLKVDARIICKLYARDIIILDVDREKILTIPSYVTRDSIKLVYNPPCPAYSGGHFDAYIREEVVKASSMYTDDYSLIQSAVEIASRSKHVEQKHFEIYINEPSSVVGRLLTSGEHAYQLKRGRALLRFDMNHPTRQLNQCEQVELDSSHLYSCIEQALKSENVSQLAKVLAEYESESRSADGNSPEHGTELMTLSLSHKACKLFLFSGSSAEAEVYGQLVVERINDGDITTALKLCCIGHQIQIFRDTIKINLHISDVRTRIYTFDQMIKVESYEQERSEFLSICDEWYRVLEPHRLMNIEQRELLREWISTRQYATTEDPIVSLVIEKCSEPKKEEEEKKWQKAEKMRKEEREEARKRRDEEWEEDMKKMANMMREKEMEDEN